MKRAVSNVDGIHTTPLCSIGDVLQFTGERYIYETTTILDAWRRQWADRLGCALDHAVLFRVSGPGWVPLCPGGRLLAHRPLSGAAPGRSAPADTPDRRAPSALASSAWTVPALPGCRRKYVLRHL